MSEEPIYHSVPRDERGNVELRRTLSRVSTTLNRNGDLNKDREEIERLAQLLTRTLNNERRSELDRQQLIGQNTGKYRVQDIR